MSLCWIYHETEEPKIVTDEQAEEFYKDGWANSPARFIKLKDIGIDKDKIKAGDVDEEQRAQQAMDAVEGIKESLNGALNINKMNKNDLAEYAMEHYGVEIDKGKGVRKLRLEVKALTE